MVHRDGALAETRSIAYAASATVTIQYLLTQTAKVFFILPLERVARCAKPKRQYLRASAWAMHHSLSKVLHGLKGNFLTNSNVRSYPAFFPWLRPGFVERHPIFTRKATRVEEQTACSREIVFPALFVKPPMPGLLQ